MTKDHDSVPCPARSRGDQVAKARRLWLRARAKIRTIQLLASLSGGAQTFMEMVEKRRLTWKDGFWYDTVWCGASPLKHVSWRPPPAGSVS